MLQKGHVILFLFLWATLPALGQDCALVVRGIVEDIDGEVLPGATITLENSQSGTVSHAKGEFELTNLCPGQHTLRITYIGYEDQRVNVRVPAPRLQIIRLRPSVKVLHDIVIEGSHGQTHGLTQAIAIVSEEELISRRGKTLGEMLQDLPGVTNIMSGPGVFKPVIHGLHSQRILVLNNGLKQEGQQWGIDHAPEIDPYIASELEVVKGPETVRYGAEAMGGVILVNPSPLHYSAGLGGELNLALASNNRMGVISGMMEGGFRNSSEMGWRVQGTLRKGGDYHAPSYNLSNTGAEEANMSLAWGLRKQKSRIEIFASTFNTEIGVLRSAHTGNLNDLQSSIANKRPWYVRDFTWEIANPRQKVGHHLVKASFERTLPGKGIIFVTYGGQYNQRKEYDIRRDKENIPALSLDLYTHTLDATYEYSRKEWSGSIGINGTLRNNDNKTGIGLLPDYSQVGTGLFAFQKYRRGKWLLEFGARLDHQRLSPRMFNDRMLLKPDFTFTFASGSFGSSVYLSEHSRISSNLGLSTRAPLMNELFSQGLHHGSASIEEGVMVQDGQLITERSLIKNETSWKWATTFQHQRENLFLEIGGFVNYFNNYIFLSPYESRLTIRGFFPVFQYQQTEAFLAGGDLSADVDLSQRWSYALRASYVMAENHSGNGKLPFVPPGEFQNAVAYTIPFLGRWKNITTRLVSRTVLRQTRAPETIYPADLRTSEVTRTFDFMPAPSAYTLLGAQIAARFSLSNRDLTLTLSGENLLNTSYRNYLNRLRYFADETGRNILLRVNYKFHSH